MGRTFIATVVLLVLGTNLVAGAEAAPSVEALLKAAGVKPQAGLCVQIECGDGQLTAALAKAGLLVQGLSADPATVEKARKTIHAAGVYGRASAIPCDFKELPYIDNTVSLLLAEDLPTALAKGLALGEIMRVLSPLGVAYLGGGALSEAELKARLAQAGIEGFELVNQGGPHARVVKPWPKGMDEWNHWRNKADANPVSKDTLTGPPAHIQWLADPRWTVAGDVGQVRVTAKGRLFYGGGWGIEGVKYDKNPLYLIARDAFNGLFLWKRPYPGLAARSGRQAKFVSKLTLAAEGDRVYVVLDPDKPLECLDAATGKTLVAYKDAGIPGEVLSCGGTLVLAGGGPVRAIDAASGAVRWKSQHNAGQVIAGDGKVFFEAGPGCVALDLTTGQEAWRSAGRLGAIQFHQDGTLYFLDASTTRAVSAKDGRPLWEFTAVRTGGSRKGAAVPVVFFSQGLCWNNVKGTTGGHDYYVAVDPATGKEVRRVPHMLGGGRCFPDVFSEHYVYATDFNCLNLKTGDYHHGTNFSRPMCGIGGLPANGLFYPFVNTCMCYGQTRGLMATAPARPEEPRLTPGNWQDRLEKGPAYGKTRPAAAAAGKEDWPTFRHDAFRSGFVPTAVPADGGRLWEVTLGQTVSAPVVADGRVFIAATDSHQVFALDAKTGNVLWSHTAAGRVHIPPTIFEGLCLFGSLDGSVTCLTAEKGELVWRGRAAPSPRQIVAYEQLESPWPVFGVLVEGGAAFFAAGRASDADGGFFIHAVDPHTGGRIWQMRHRTASWSYHQDPATGRFLWIDPRVVEGATVKPDPQEWTIEKLPALAQARLFSKGGAYKTDPASGRIVWLTDSQLKDSPEKAAWQTWKGELLKDVVGGTTVRLKELLLADILVADRDAFHLKSWSFAYKNGESRYSGGGSALKSVRGGANLMDNVNCWRAFSWLAHKQYYGDGRPLVYDKEWAYGSKPPQVGQSRMDVLGKGVQVGAWTQGPAPEGATRARKPWRWEVNVPVRTLAMAVTADALFVAGVSDSALSEDLSPEEFWGRLEGKDGGALHVFSKTDGKLLHQGRLPALPIFDGMAAASGRLYLACEGGKLLCLGKQ